MSLEESTHFDLVVIGGGSAGYAAARTAHAAGLRTAVVDGARELGGLCILRGCMPSKALIESAERNLTLRRAAEFGLKLRHEGIDLAFIQQRKRRLVAEFASYRQGQLEDGRFTLLRGSTSFEDAHHLRLQSASGSKLLSASSVVIATGSVPQIPKGIEGLETCGYWGSDQVLDAAALPKRIAVLGAGAIALEMAHYLEAMGCAVHLFARSGRLLSSLDPECGQSVARSMEKRGIALHLGAFPQRIEKTATGKSLHWHDGNQPQSLEVDEILLATGRQPATDGLNLERAGLRTEGAGLVVNANMQTNQPHIFAAGDVCSPLAVVHVAITQGEIAARNAARLLQSPKEDLEPWINHLPLLGIFCHPQVASVGATPAQLSQQGVDFISASYPFDDHGKSLVMGETEGFVKILARRSDGRILGASCVGPAATELIHEMVLAMHLGASVQQIASMPHYHPTLSEIWTYPAEECAEAVAT